MNGTQEFPADYGRRVPYGTYTTNILKKWFWAFPKYILKKYSKNGLRPSQKAPPKDTIKIL